LCTNLILKIAKIHFSPSGEQFPDLIPKPLSEIMVAMIEKILDPGMMTGDDAVGSRVSTGPTEIDFCRYGPWESLAA
jgi:hypothetical protein